MVAEEGASGGMVAELIGSVAKRIRLDEQEQRSCSVCALVAPACARATDRRMV